MTVTFCGHSDHYLDAAEYDKLKKIITQVITDGATTFLCGAYGSFDNACASILRELKAVYPHIEILAVTPYITENYNERNQYLKEHYDDVIYPPLESVPLKFAISRRNEWMVERSDIVISGVRRSFGGAAQTLAYAKRKKKTIIKCND